MKVIEGDCVEVMRGMEPNSIDAIVTDPPYDLTAGKKGGSGPKSENLESPYGRARITTGFMGKSWDGTGVAFDVATWEAAMHVLKPGAHVLAFGAPRTFWRMIAAMDAAGLEIRDCISWLFGSGFPKSLDVSKAIDKAAGAAREIIGPSPRHSSGQKGNTDSAIPDLARYDSPDIITAPATDLARQWEGWGTALKPGWEPCVVARKPLTGTVAANVAEYGTGAINVDACRIGTDDTRRDNPPNPDSNREHWRTGHQGGEFGSASGRWPANVVLDEEAAAMLDEQSGERTSGRLEPWHTDGGKTVAVYGDYRGRAIPPQGFGGDSGGASRFFYTAKASRSEREAWGRMTLPANRRSDGRAKDIDNPRLRTSERINDHPTVKPLALMEWLLRLVTPPGGVVLDPFCGSGSTLVAARKLNIEAIGIEQDERSAEIARQRIDAQWEVTLL